MSKTIICATDFSPAADQATQIGLRLARAFGDRVELLHVIPRSAFIHPELVATARRLLGVPYLWGGMTPLGVDCSGFVSLVYRVHGRVLPRDADLQFDDPESSPVEKDRLAAGDLLFFGKTTITHVGMYMGDGRFIDATTHETPVVREDRLDDPHWAELYKGARRPK